MARRSSRGSGASRPLRHQVLVIRPSPTTVPPSTEKVEDTSAVEDAPSPDAPIDFADVDFTDVDFAKVDLEKIPIAFLTLDVPLIPFNFKKREPIAEAKPKHFLFLTLPSELRVRIYQYYFQDADKTLDLAPENYKRYHKRMGIVRVCRQLHDEVTHYFYSTRTVRVFPTDPGKYYKAKKPLLARMKANQRSCLGVLELRLGPGWNNPPRNWVVNDALGLADCINVHTLRVFVECDPSDGYLKGFRRTEGLYERFSRELFAEVVKGLPSLRVIEFDAWPSVKRSGFLMRGLLDVAEQSKRTIGWGPERGWTDNPADGEKDSAASFARKYMDNGMLVYEYAAQNIVAAA
ncbi:hypothetical protein HJFPF1_00223 [Paramyrothecium foliicola]|nr:hypothetical protein HJFPF1_00223 [Paramyrothecium foliicola]